MASSPVPTSTVGASRAAASRSPGAFVDEGAAVEPARRRPDPSASDGPVLFVGAPGTRPGAVLAAVAGVPESWIAPRDAEPCWTLLRPGRVASASAFYPGHRREEPMDLDGLGGARVIRQPRRVEIEHQSPLLELIRLAGAPELTDLDPAGSDIVLDAVERSAGLVFVAGPAPLERSHLDLLRAMTTRPDRLVFVRPDGYGTPGDSDSDSAARPASPLACDSVLAAAPWYVASDEVPTGAGHVVSGGLEALRLRLASWGTTRRRALVSVPRQTARYRPAPVSPPDCEAWRETLDRETLARRAAAGEQVVEYLAEALSRCLAAVGPGAGGTGLPRQLDRELHALSVRVTRRLERDAAAVVGAVCRSLIGVEPDVRLLARVDAALQRVIESSEDSRPPQALLLTTTSGVAIVTGDHALESTSVLGKGAGRATTLAPIVVAVSTSCFRRWRGDEDRGRPENSSEQRLLWLRRALAAVGAQVLRELDRRYDDLRLGLGLLAEDAIDHGFLLV